MRPTVQLLNGGVSTAQVMLMTPRPHRMQHAPGSFRSDALQPRRAPSSPRQLLRSSENDQRLETIKSAVVLEPCGSNEEAPKRRSSASQKSLELGLALSIREC